MIARPRRSVLYMPGSNTKALAKASTLPADALILDLEDSVAPEAKEAARAPCGRGGEGRFRRARGGDPGQWPAHALGSGGPDRRGGGGTRRDPSAQGRRAGRDHAGRAGAARERRPGKDPPVGDDGDAERHSQRRVDRRGRRRLRLAPRGSGDGPQRSRQGDARPPDPRPADHDRLARQLRRRGARPRRRHHRRRLQRHQGPRRASAPSASRAATWGSTARP